jgi:LPXTG-site transpeptidase (sortase) family protein
MRRLKLHNWLFLLGLGLAGFGIVNAASVVSDIAIPAQDRNLQEEESYGPLIDGPEGVTTSSDNFAGHEQSVVRIQHPSTSFLASARSIETQPSFLEGNRDLVLSEMYAADMLSPDIPAVEIPALSKPTAPEIPVRLIIPAIELDAPVLTSEAEIVQIKGKPFQVWHAPAEFAAGWHVSSAPLGVPGNTVLNGHHNTHGEVFKRLVELEQGAEIILKSEARTFSYIILNKMILPEKYVPLEERVLNSQWILPSDDERLTIVTCWPYESNTHRLILVAQPNNP